MKVHKKNPSWMTGGMATMLLCTLLFSCNNEDFLESGNPEKACDNICFGISSDKNMQTRGYAGSDDEGYTAGRFVLRSDDSADTLCVRAIVSDGINVSGFEGEQALTRGTPVTKDNFYNNFHVLAYWKKNGTLVDNQFYMDENATNNGSVWSTEQTYYWPGAEHSFQFYAWAPTDANGLTTPSTPQSTVLAYTVPKEATAQKDIVVATTEEIQGDNNKAVPLTFKHICTAVRFVVGSQMQPGSIKSVALEGVKNVGTYDMAAGTWTLGGDLTDFSQDLNKTTTGNETDGDMITSAEGTFMMLPQTLPDGAKVKVVFTNASGDDRTLTASIGNTEWTMGTTVTYKLSITPEYEMNIEVPSEAQDAHYISFSITVNVKDYDGAWTLTSNFPNDVFFTQTKTDLQEQGYWIDEDKGTATITSTGSGSFTYYVYVTENIGDAVRDLQLQITPNINNAEATTAIVQQLCPSWNGSIGCERIEDGAYPWGFKWDRKVVYEFSGINLFLKYIFENRFETTGTYYTYEMKDYLIYKICNVTIDYTKLSSLSGANNEDGLANTKYLYNYAGSGGNIDELEQFCINYESLIGGKFKKTSEEGGSTMPTNYAAFEALKHNKFSKQVIENNGETVIMPLLKEENMVWYLPSSTECLSITDEYYPLKGNYWTSNAVEDNTEAYYFTVSGNQVQVAQGDRLDNCNIRTVRKK